MQVRQTLLLDNLTVNHPINSDLLDPHLCAGRGDAVKLPSLCATGSEPYDDLVALSDDVIHALIPVGERSSVPCDRTLDAIQSLLLRSNDEVTDIVGGI